MSTGDALDTSVAPTQTIVSIDALLDARIEAGVDRVLARRLGASWGVRPLVLVHERMGCSSRYAAKPCRAGDIDGAVLVARRWRAPVDAIDAYLARLAARRPARRTTATAAQTDDARAHADAVLAELGLERRGRR
jgi:hypothetical protein